MQGAEVVCFCQGDYCNDASLRYYAQDGWDIAKVFFKQTK